MIGYATRTDAGSTHADNQDRLAADPRRGTFVVADGIGGLADAAATAQTVVERLPADVHAGVRDLRRGEVAVAAATTALSGHLHGTARCGPGTTGATAAMVLVRGSTALALHLGDSRIYLADGDGLVRLTEDHVRDGQLTRWVGMGGSAVPDVSVHRLRRGDRLLLCTDGLTRWLTDAELARLLTASGTLADICGALVGAARTAGSTDDISVIVLERRRWS